VRRGDKFPRGIISSPLCRARGCRPPRPDYARRVPSPCVHACVIASRSECDKIRLVNNGKNGLCPVGLRRQVIICSAKDFYRRGTERDRRQRRRSRGSDRSKLSAAPSVEFPAYSTMNPAVLVSARRCVHVTSCGHTHARAHSALLRQLLPIVNKPSLSRNCAPRLARSGVLRIHDNLSLAPTFRPRFAKLDRVRLEKRALSRTDFVIPN